MTATQPTTIEGISFGPLDVPLIEPFAIATGAQPTAHNVLVELRLADGTRGYGEAAPFPAFNGETQDSALAAVEAARPLVEGRDVQAWRPISTALRDRIGAAGSARCATLAPRW